MIRRKTRRLGQAFAGFALLCVCCSLVLGCAGKTRTNPAPEVGDRTYRQIRDAGRTTLSEQGDAYLALALYTQAMTRAQTTLDESAMAEATYGRAASLARLRRYDEALSALETTGFKITPTQQHSHLLLITRIHLEQGQVEDATATLDEAESIATTTAPGTRTFIRLTRGQLAAMAGDIKSAKAGLVGEASALPAPLRAQHHRLSGMIASIEADDAKAAESYMAEADAARAYANWPAAAEATARAAEALASAGDAANAAQLYLQAGQSATLQQHANLPAKQWLNAAIMTAEEARNTAIVDRAKQLIEAQSHSD